jgi:molecular chaperone HscB
VCAQCGRPLAAELDLFAALGLDRRLVIEPTELERRYHDLGRRIHPDRFVSSAAPIKEASLKSTALLTRAYRVLRDPVSRGRYWLELHGEKLAEDNKQVPAELAALVFEVQEQLAELRETTDRSSRQSLVEVIRGWRSTVQELMDQAGKELSANFAAWDEGRAEARALLLELKATLSKIAYLRTLLRDIDRELEPPALSS